MTEQSKKSLQIAILGAGNVGKALGEGWKKAGYSVVYTSKDLAETAHILEKSQVVLMALPWNAVQTVLQSLTAEYPQALAGKVLIDATNPIGAGLRSVAHTLTHTATQAASTDTQTPIQSGAQAVSLWAPNAHVIKAFNTTGFENMIDPKYGAETTWMPVAGDNPEAVALAVQLAQDLGFGAQHVGGLTWARELEAMALLWIRTAMQLGQGRAIAFGLLRR